MEKIKSDDFEKVYQLFDQRIEQNNSNSNYTLVIIALCLILFLFPKIVFCQGIPNEPTKTVTNEQTKTQEQQRPIFALFNNFLNGGNIAPIQSVPNQNAVGNLSNDIFKSEIDGWNTKFSSIQNSLIETNKLVKENSEAIKAKSQLNSYIPIYSPSIYLPKIHFPKIHFPKEIVVKTSSSYASSATDSNAREIALLNQSIKELKDHYKELESSIPHFDWSKNYVNVLSFMAFFAALLYIVLYLSRLLRYYLKLTHHYKDRKLALQLHEELKIPVEEAMIIISSSHIDFKVPKMPYDLLANYYNNKNQTDCSCCCRCCSKCERS